MAILVRTALAKNVSLAIRKIVTFLYISFSYCFVPTLTQFYDRRTENGT